MAVKAFYSASMYVCMCVCLYVCMCICTYVCIHNNIWHHALPSSGFALVLGLSVPLVLALLMWLLPKLCPPAEELGEEERETTEGNERGTSFEEKNSSMESQLVLWLLMLGALLSAVLLVIFLSLSLTGSVWVTSGVSKASLAARDIIPEVRLQGIRWLS